MAAATEFSGDFVDVHLLIFRAQADARQVRLQFLEEAGDHDGRDGADVIDKAFGVVRFRSCSGVVGFFQPEIGDLVVMYEAEIRINVLEQFRARKGIGLINLVANGREIGAASDEFRADVECAGTRRGILKRAGIGRNGGEEAIRDLFRDRPLGDFKEAENQFAAGGFAGRNPVHMGVARVAGVMVNIDELLAIGDAGTDGPETFKARAIRGDDAVKFLAAFWLLEEAFGIEEGEFLGHRVLVPDGDFFPLAFESEGKAELGTDAIAIRPDMADDAKSAMVADFFEDPVDGFGVTLH